MTLRTHIDQEPGRAATGRSATAAGSDVERDTCGRWLAPADEMRPPRAGAAWPPRMAPARPWWLCMRAQVPLAATNCDSLVMVRLGSDGAKVGYGSAKQKYGVGSMNRSAIRNGDRFDPIDLCVRGAPRARGRVWIIKLPSDLKLQRSHNFEWAIWSSGGAPVETQLSLARATHCAHDSRESSP